MDLTLLIPNNKRYFFSSQSREATVEHVVYICNRTSTKQSITLSQTSSSAMCLVIF